MNGADIGVLIAALALSITAFTYAVHAGRGWQRINSDVHYIRRDLDQLLKLYRLTPVEEQERKRRR